MGIVMLAGMCSVGITGAVPTAAAASTCPAGASSAKGAVKSAPGVFEVVGEKNDAACPVVIGGPVPQYVYESFRSWTLEGAPLSGDLPCDDGGVWKSRFPVVDGEVQRDQGEMVCVGGKTEPTVSPGAVLREIQRIGLPAGKLSVQPLGGRTLVNFDTIFSTTADEMTRSITVAGIPVRVRVWPSAYTWHWGDDSDPLPTAEPGRPYEKGLAMDEYITHKYVDAGVTVQPRVDVTYSAEFSVRGGDWQQVDGTVTIDGAPVSVRVVEAKPVLTGSH